jgi:hypothetical protein
MFGYKSRGKFTLLFIHLGEKLIILGRKKFRHTLIECRVAKSSEKSGKFLKFERFSDFLLTF